MTSSGISQSGTYFTTLVLLLFGITTHQFPVLVNYRNLDETKIMTLECCTLCFHVMSASASCVPFCSNTHMTLASLCDFMNSHSGSGEMSVSFAYNEGNDDFSDVLRMSNEEKKYVEITVERCCYEADMFVPLVKNISNKSGYMM